MEELNLMMTTKRNHICMDLKKVSPNNMLQLWIHWRVQSQGKVSFKINIYCGYYCHYLLCSFAQITNYTASVCVCHFSSPDVCCRQGGRFNLHPSWVLYNWFYICPRGTNVSVTVERCNTLIGESLTTMIPFYYMKNVLTLNSKSYTTTLFPSSWLWWNSEFSKQDAL